MGYAKMLIFLNSTQIFPQLYCTLTTLIFVDYGEK